MRFWDSSAIAPRLLEETSSESMRQLLREDREMVVWWGSRVECVSAVRRRDCEVSLDAADSREALELRRSPGVGAGADRAELVCLDRRLADAASREGLETRPAPAGEDR